MQWEKIKALLKNGTELYIPVKGTSMKPFLQEDSFVFVRERTGRPKIGGVYFFEGFGDKPILHRLIRKTDEGFIFRGDAQELTEGPIPEERILAELTGVCRRGRIYTKRSLIWRFFRFIHTGNPWKRRIYRKLRH